MRYGRQSTDFSAEPETTNQIIGEIEKRYGPLGPSEREGILRAYTRLSERFSAHEDGHAALLVEWEPGTTLAIFGNSDEHFPGPDGEIGKKWIDTGTPYNPGPAFIRALPDNRICDCIFSLWITGEPACCEVIPASRGWRGIYRYGPMLWPEYREYLFRYLLKEAGGTDHGFRFTWLIGFREIFNCFDCHPELLRHELLVPNIRDVFANNDRSDEKNEIGSEHARRLFGDIEIPASIRTEIERVTGCRLLSGR